jgi:hypothetical protein
MDAESNLANAIVRANKNEAASIKKIPRRALVGCDKKIL